MIVEPTLEPNNVFGLIEIDDCHEFKGFTTKAKEIFANVSQVFFIIGTGLTGIGKSTKLTQLIIGAIKDFFVRESSPIFKTGSGPNPITGYSRDNMNYPCYGPVLLSTFCKRWEIQTKESDDKIALFFIDSQGTGSIKDDDTNTIIANTILSTVIGLRLCFAPGPRPLKNTYGEIDGSLSLNVLVQKKDGLASGYAIGVIYRDCYETLKETGEIKAKRKEDNEEYTQIWMDHNPKLKNTDFHIWLFESPRNLDGYLSEMKEVAEFITDIARKKKRSIQSVEALLNTAATYVNEIAKSCDRLDNFEFESTDLLQIMIYHEIGPIIESVDASIPIKAKEIIDSINEKDILDINQNDLKNTLFEVVKKIFIQKADEFWGDFQNEFPSIVEEECGYIRKQIDELFSNYYQCRCQMIIDKIQKEIETFSQNLIQSYSAKSKNEIESIQYDKNSCILNDQLKKWRDNVNSEFDSQIPIICLSQSIQSSQAIEKYIKDKRVYVLTQIELQINYVYNEIANKAHTKEIEIIKNQMLLLKQQSEVDKQKYNFLEGELQKKTKENEKLRHDMYEFQQNILKNERERDKIARQTQQENDAIIRRIRQEGYDRERQMREEYEKRMRQMEEQRIKDQRQAEERFINLQKAHEKEMKDKMNEMENKYGNEMSRIKNEVLESVWKNKLVRIKPNIPINAVPRLLDRSNTYFVASVSNSMASLSRSRLLKPVIASVNINYLSLV